MSLYRSLLTGFLAVVCIVFLAGCGDPSDRVIGGWKTEAPNAATGKVVVLILTKENANVDGVSCPVTYRSLAANVEIMDTAKNQPLFAAAKIDKNSMEATGDIFGGKVKLLRITEEEAFKLLKGDQE